MEVFQTVNSTIIFPSNYQPTLMSTIRLNNVFDGLFYWHVCSGYFMLS